MQKSIIGNVLSPTHTSNERHYVHNRIDARKQESYHETNYFEQDTPSLVLNSSNARVLTMTGNRNRGVIMNDPIFHRKSIFEQPIFLSLNQRHATESLLLTLLAGLLVVILLAVYYRRKKVGKHDTRLQPQQHTQQHHPDDDPHPVNSPFVPADNDDIVPRPDPSPSEIIDRLDALDCLLSHSSS
jgi:hypothetical protein